MRADPEKDIEALRVRVLSLLDGPGRRFVAIAGPPGSGKSTVAAALHDRIEAGSPGLSAILPMDGFHYDDGLLDALDRRHRKGAPDTFDAGGLIALLHRLRGPEPDIAVPVFDRALEISRGSARLIGTRARLILVEGNYLLLDLPPWDGLAGLFDLTVMIETPEAELARRLDARWRGLGLSDDRIRDKLDGNDLPNGRQVRRHSRAADLVLRQR